MSDRSLTRAAPRDTRGRRGFTLLDLLLALAVMMLIASASVMGLRAWQADDALERSALWYDAAIRQARAEAMRLGRRVKLEFDADSGVPVILCEMDPVGLPGVYVPRPTTWPGGGMGARVTRCQLVPEDPAALTLTGKDEQGSDETVMPAVRFESDGTSDWAWIELAMPDDAGGNGGRTAVLELNGLTGEVRTTVFGAEQLQSFYEQQRAAQP